MNLKSGARLGPYEIHSLIGVGGMGEVYRAYDPRLERFIAIKILSSGNSTDAERKRRFAQEARAASALNHPGIVTVYDVGSESGMDYIVMEFLAGSTLEALIPRNGFSIRDLLCYSAQAADAIAKAHSASILHRDIKPGNLIVTNDGCVKVLDFGLAKLERQPAHCDERTTASAAITDECVIVGTPAYMSPEQAEGRPLDRRSDVFSFGSMLYEMATGRRPFQGDTAVATILSILRDEPVSVREIRPEMPPELERLIRRCLKKDPARRVQSMSDLKVALEELKEELDSGQLNSVSPPPGRKETGMVRAGTVIVVCAAIAIGFIQFPPRNRDQTVSRPTPLTSYQGAEREPDFSPDGNQVAFTWNGEHQDNSDIYLKVVGSSAAPLRLTTDPAADSVPRWSPDGKSIAFVRTTDDDDAIMLTSALGGAERKIAAFPAAVQASISWSPDSKWLAVAAGARDGPTALRLVSVDTGESRALTTPPSWSRGDFDPEFSPDGRSLAFVRERGMNVEELWVVALSDSYEARGGPRKILGDGRKNHNPRWSADGRELIFSSGELALAAMYRIPADGSGAPVRIEAPGDGVTEPALSASRHRLAFARTFRSAGIWRFDIQSKGGVPKELIASSSSFRDVFPQYSPDGRKIVFYSNRTGLTQIWMSNSDGAQPVQLTSMTGTTTGTPRWSPDGRWISFDSNSGGNWQIYMIAAGGGRPVAVTIGDMTNVVSSWSRDGKWIYFSSRRSGTEQVWKVAAPASLADPIGVPVQVTRHGGTSSLESPDGAELYFTKTTPGFDFSLWRMPTRGGDEIEVTPSLHRYNFVVASDSVFFATPSGPDSPAELKKLSLSTGRIASLYTLPKRIDLGLDLSPDHRYLLFSQLDYIGSDLMLVDGFM